MHNVSAHDLRNVAPSVSSFFNPSSLLFLLSDSGFVAHPPSVPFLSSLAFSLPLQLLRFPLLLLFLSLRFLLLSLPFFLFLPPFLLLRLLLPLFLFLSFLLLTFLLLLLLSLFLCFLLLLSLRLLFALPGLLCSSFCSSGSTPSFVFFSSLFLPLRCRLCSFPLLLDVGGGGAPPEFPPVSSQTSSSAPSSSSSSSSSAQIGDLAEFQAWVLGLSAEYQALGRWFVASMG